MSQQQKLDTFKQRYLERSVHLWGPGTAQTELYNQAKVNLEKILFFFRQSKKTIEEKKILFGDFIQQLQVCAQGISTSLWHIACELLSEDSVDFCLARFRTELVKETAMKFLGTYQDPLGPYYGGLNRSSG